MGIAQSERQVPMNRLNRISVSGIASFVVVAVVAAAVQAGPFIRWQPAGKGLPAGGEAAVKELSAGGTPATAAAIVEGKGLFLSTDLGSTWAACQGEAACLKDPYAVCVSPADGKTIYAAPATAGGGLWRSTDGGKTWASCGSKAGGMADEDVEWITVYPADAKLILVGHRAGKAISVSPDGGKTWLARPIGADVAAQIPFAITDTRWFLASRKDGGAMYFTEDSGATWKKSTGNIGQFPGPLPVVQTGEYVFSSVHHGTNKSTDGGKTFAYAMERHARVIGTLGANVIREDRESIYGQEARVMTIAMSEDYANSWQDVTGALVQLVPKELRGCVTIENKVDPFAHVRFATAWAAVPDGRTGFLALGKAGVYRCDVMWNKGGPILGDAALTPPAVLEGDSSTEITVRVSSGAKFGKLKKVWADLSSIGQGELELLDDGKHGDAEAGDRIFGGTFHMPAGGAPAGEVTIGLLSEDDGGRISSLTAGLKVASTSARKIVWDGEKFAHGLGWVAPKNPFNFLKSQTEDAHSGKVALELHGDGSGFIGGGWNWHGWYPENSGTDVSEYRNLSFWMKVVGDDPGGINVGLNNSTTKKATKKVGAQDYCRDLLDGKWHEIIVPLVDIYQGSEGNDPTKMWEFDIEIWKPQARRFSIFVDDIGFDNRNVRAHSVWTKLPEARKPGEPLAANAAKITAEVDAAAPGLAISPWIYGAAMADRELAKEIGLTVLRAGGNPVSPFNWKKGFGGKGADWFYQNEGTETAPESTWLAKFHGLNKAAGMESYLTLPSMGRVAKDGTGVAFDTKKYPDQTDWAGRSQPTDRLPTAGSGIQYVRGADGKSQTDEKGNRKTRKIEADPNDTSVPMSPQEQTEFLRFMIEKMNYGPADKGGIRVVALDNEPFLWNSTHRGMYPKGLSYDGLWGMTRTYAELLKKIDPKVQVACGTFWGWTAYFYSGRDRDLIEQGKGTWKKPVDFAEHGSVPVTKWLLKQLADHEKKTGQRLADILDWHFYPQTGIYMAGAAGDAKTMQHRVEETRVLWDPTYKDPSWMGEEQGHIIRLLPMMKEWIAECYPGTKTAIGEYNFGGEQDASGCLAQAEVLGIFAREGIDYAFYWFAPSANSPSYFAYKMYRNPDGKGTAFGDRYLPAKVSQPTDVSVHAARDEKSGRLTFIVINKRLDQDAKLTLKLARAIPEQDVTVYEYSRADRFAIGQLPARKMGGQTVDVDLPAFSVLRFDVRP
jgi:photosystem II stability/assembly factor-like uncharacterized protein